MALITHQGMSEAIANLQPNPATLKGRLIILIRSYFPTEESLETIESIAAEDLIRQLWEVDAPEDVRQKKKNLSSLKSSINKDLKNLAREGKNQEGLVISRDNVFTVSDEHKNDLLQKLGLSGALGPKDLLSLMRGILNTVMQNGDRQEAASSLLKELDKTREMFAQAAGLIEDQANLSSGSATAGPAAGPPVEGAGAGTAIDGAEGEPVTGELIEADEFELLDEEEILEEAEMVVDAAGQPADGLDGGEMAGPGRGEDAAPAGGDAGTGGDDAAPAADEWLEEDAFELLDEEEISEEAEMVVDAAGQPADGLDGGEMAGPGRGEDAAPADGDAGTGGDDASPAADELIEADEFELLDEEEILEEQAEMVVDAAGQPADGLDGGEMAGPGRGEDAAPAGGAAGTGGDDATPAADELIEADEFELLDEEEILEEQAEMVVDAAGQPADGLDGGEMAGLRRGEDGGPAGAAAGTEGDDEAAAADELIEADEFELLDEEEILEEAEMVVDAAGQPADGLDGGEMVGPGRGEDAAPAGAAAGTGGDDARPAADELIEADEFELLDEEEILEEAEMVVDAAGQPADGLDGGEMVGPGRGEDAAPAGGAAGTGGDDATPAADELIEADEFELLDEAEILEEAEMVDAEQITPVSEVEVPDDARGEAARPLDLSHYIEPDEALACPPETLVETHDEYITQILERFLPKFIKIPAGHYLTGRDQPAYNERPARKIFLQSFYMGQLPVTNDLFDFFVRETGYETDAEKAGFGNVVEGRISNRIDPDTGRTVLSISRGTRSQRIRGANWRHPCGPDSSLENKGNHPVVQVSRQDALAFAAWAGKRLPSEDEWEAAARGLAGLLFPWGNEWRGELSNTESSLTGDTTPVIRHGKPSMSPFGVYDLLGNVFEWTSTVHSPSRPANRPPPVYVLKGGCWTSKPGVTAAARLLEPDTWANTIGFRCAV